MPGFLEALAEHAFLRNALLAGVLASVACGVVGSYVVARRITYIAGGIAHFALGGMGAARYLETVWGWTWLHPIHGAIVSAVAAALIIGQVTLRARGREDTVVSALWAVGMAVGVIFISRTPGYNEDLMSYLFGNILMVSKGDLWLIGALDLVALGAALGFHKQLLAVCFDEEFARLRGVRVEAFYLLLLCLTALTVVLLITVVGLVMVIALLTLPVAVAGHFSRTLWQVMGISAGLSCVFTTLGLGLSYGADLPAGATIIVLAAVAYIAVAAGSAVVRRWRRLKSSGQPGTAGKA